MTKALDFKLILALSMFGLAMGVATVFVISSKVEPICWLAIFVLCAIVIAKRRTSHFFWHGFLVSVVNSIWITVAHVLLFESYIATHAAEAAMASGMPLPPRAMMLVTGPVIGVISGLVLGLFAFVASKLLRPSPSAR